MGDRVAASVLVVVTAVWAGTSLVLPVLVSGYTTPAEIHTIMGTVAGAVAAHYLAQRNRKGKE